jgi:flagellar basal body-associated protein FliL
VLALLRFALGRKAPMGILWIILVVLVVLALLAFFSRSHW